MKKWMDKGAAKAEGGTPAPRGVLTCKNLITFLWSIVYLLPKFL